MINMLPHYFLIKKLKNEAFASDKIDMNIKRAIEKN